MKVGQHTIMKGGKDTFEPCKEIYKIWKPYCFQVLASFAYQILPYRRFSSGVLRTLEHYPEIDFIDDREGNQFKCMIWRKL